MSAYYGMPSPEEIALAFKNIDALCKSINGSLKHTDFAPRKTDAQARAEEFSCEEPDNPVHVVFKSCPSRTLCGRRASASAEIVPGEVETVDCAMCALLAEGYLNGEWEIR